VRGFDHTFFGMSKSEAVSTDPNIRVMMECCYECLEGGGVWGEEGCSNSGGSSAADPPSLGTGPIGSVEPWSQSKDIGVFLAAGSLPNYLVEVLQEYSPHAAASAGSSGSGDAAETETTENVRLSQPSRYLQLEVGNDKDYLATRIAFTFNLTGPALTLQTACSSALLCVAEAVRAIRDRRTGRALAGGVSILTPQRTGYRYVPGSIFSPDGRCRPFSDRANGTHNSNACGVVLLRSLRDALAAGTILVVQYDAVQYL
jgi:acyl transferase domain-containing protein